MPTYTEEVASAKQFYGNVVILLGGEYFATRQPDSGLEVKLDYRRAIGSLVLNQSMIDIRKASTSIVSNSFRLVDNKQIVSRLVRDTGANLIGTEVRIWLGRSNVSMDFSDYLEITRTQVAKISEVDESYEFATKEPTNKMQGPVCSTKVRLNGDIIAGTTTILSTDDISKFASSGYFRIGTEIISYASKNDGTKTFSGCARGEFSTTPAAHEDGDEMCLTEILEGHPIDILLQVLISNGGGGSYDVLADGAGIDPDLLDVAAMEDLRDGILAGLDFSLALYDQANALQFLEREILTPCNLRFTSLGAKTSLAILDRAEFTEEDSVVNDDSITSSPQKIIDDTKIVNQITVEWDYNEGTRKFASRQVFEDEESIALYGKNVSPLSFQWKGVTDADLVEEFAVSLLERLSTPKPEIKFRTHIDKSLLNLGDKALVETSKLSNYLGRMGFSANMELVEKAINHQTAEATLRFSYTSFTEQRLGFIAPSEPVVSSAAQDEMTAASGKAADWQVGWKVRLYDSVAGEYTADPVNEIAGVAGDVITFVDDWTTTLTTDHSLEFADYEDCVASQKRYAFVCVDEEEDFAPGEKAYKIVP